VSTTSLTFGPTGGKQAVGVTANCSWTAVGVNGWMKSSYDTQAGTVTISVDANRDNDIRISHVFIHSSANGSPIDITITQTR
ncbi:MAG: BACON domain-containing protein, partial [Coprobacter sp.]|nr:BACON domain-containing protein [Coprobacter sp.]